VVHAHRGIGAGARAGAAVSDRAKDGMSAFAF
jgi:hypothetical protein